MKPSEVMKKKGWSIGAYARDENGNPFDIPPYHVSPKAKSCCILGAMRMSFGDDQTAYGEAYSRVHERLVQRGWEYGIIAFNDQGAKTKDECVQLLEECGL